MIKMFCVYLIVAMLAIFGMGTADLLGQESDSEARIRELEERLGKLEEAQKSEANSTISPGTENGRDDEIDELHRQIDVLSAEIEKLRSGEQEIEIPAEQAATMGLGPSAASVYRKNQGVSIAGYGEMLYENFAGETQEGVESGKNSQLDFLRAVLYAGYRFNDKFIFNSEIEFEHANTSRSGSVAVEFAYIDYMAHENLTVRGGLLLIPMGLINEFHEPTAFLGARRPETERHIIPSTWREGGVGVLGSAGKLSYRAYVVNGFDASRFGTNGIRGGRQSGSKAIASDMAFTGRLDFTPTPGFFFGGSIYTGNSGQGQFEQNGQNLGVRTTIGEIHAQLQMRGLDLRALYARASIGDVAALNSLLGFTGGKSLSEILQGGYIQLGYNLLSHKSENMRITPYYRFEKLNTQESVPQDFVADPAQNRKLHTCGIEFRPITNITIKGDYQWIKNQAGSGLNQFNLNLGYSF